MKKRIFAVVAMLCVAVAGHGQYFEWAKGFASQQSGNAIVGMVADSEGNLYILANFRNDAVWDDSLRLLPIAPYGPAHNNINTMIAKMTPDGNIAWRKVVHANNGADSYAWDIKMIGDTSFAVTLSTRMPSWESEYLYWLDTLVAGVSDYPVPQGNMAGTSISAFVVFGFDGTVKEQHFLHMTAIDNDGYDIYFMHSLQEGLFPLTFSKLKFDVDGDGNIYICYPMHYITDSAYSATLGTITAVKIWVDQHVVGIIDVDTSSWLACPALLKFSPHLEAIMNYKRLIQKSVPYNSGAIFNYDVLSRTLKIDQDNNLYAIINMNIPNIRNSIELDRIIIFDSISNMEVTTGKYDQNTGVVAVMDTSLNFRKLIYLKHKIVDSTDAYNSYELKDVTTDYDSNYLFISGVIGKGRLCDSNHVNNTSFVDNTPIHLVTACFVLVFDLETLEFVRYMTVPNKCDCEMIGPFMQPGHASGNNRIIEQAGYYGYIQLPDGYYRAPNKYYMGSGMIMFDYAGNVIGGKHYNNFDLNKDFHTGNVIMQDSVLYMASYNNQGMRLGDIEIIQDWDNLSLIIKYIDTAFLTPYRPQPTEGITVLPEGDIVIAPNPAHNEISVKALDAPAKGVFIMSAIGKRQEVRLHGGKIDISHLPQGVYFLEIVTENDKYTAKFIKI